MKSRSASGGVDLLKSETHFCNSKAQIEPTGQMLAWNYCVYPPASSSGAKGGPSSNGRRRKGTE